VNDMAPRPLRELRSPAAIMDEIAALDAESAAVLATIRGLL